MDYLLAIVLPPLAVWNCRRSRPLLLTNLGLTLLVWAPGALHALWTVAQSHAEERSRRMPRLGRPNPFGAP